MITYYFRAPAASIQKDAAGDTYILGKVRMYVNKGQCYIRECSSERRFPVAFIVQGEAWGVVARIHPDIAHTTNLPKSVVCTKEDEHGPYQGVMRESLITQYAKGTT